MSRVDVSYVLDSVEKIQKEREASKISFPLPWAVRESAYRKEHFPITCRPFAEPPSVVHLYPPEGLERALVRVQGVNFDEADFGGVSLSHVVFQDCSFKKANLKGFSLASGGFNGCAFTCSDLDEVSLVDVFGHSTTFEGSTMRDSYFQDTALTAYMDSVDLSRATLRNTLICPMRCEASSDGPFGPPVRIEGLMADLDSLSMGDYETLLTSAQAFGVFIILSGD